MVRDWFLTLATDGCTAHFSTSSHVVCGVNSLLPVATAGSMGKSKLKENYLSRYSQREEGSQSKVSRV
jgi:hypothetical protein